MFKAELVKCFSIIAQIFSVLKNRIKLASFSMVSIRDIFAKYRQFALLNFSLSSIFFLGYRLLLLCSFDRANLLEIKWPKS